MIRSGLDDVLPPESERPVMCQYWRCESVAEFVFTFFNSPPQFYCTRHTEKTFFNMKCLYTETDAYPGLKEVRI